MDTLSIYALKTSPAFEAALFAGMRMAGPIEPYREPAARFARHLGVAFQILNDLEDWQHRPGNKRAIGGDVLGARPTVLWALALERLSPSDRRALAACIAAAPADGQPALDEVRRLYQQTNVFHRAEQLVTKHRSRARQVADSITPAPLGRLLHYFVDTIVPTTLDRRQ